MKRVLSVILSFCMLLSLGCGAFAANDAKDMETALKRVKARIEIPTAFSEFRYEAQTNDDTRYWNFDWSLPENANQSISVVCDDAGRISEYTVSSADSTRNRTAPKILKSEAKTRAVEFVKKAAPELLGHIDMSDVGTATNWDVSVYNYTFSRLENKAPCDTHGVEISVDSVSGKVRSMKISWDYDMVFPKTSGAITADNAKKIWKENCKIMLKYYFADDGKTAYLAYAPVNEISLIDAITGKLVTKSFEWQPTPGPGGDASAGGGGNGDEGEKLTAMEIKAAEQYSKLLSPAQADAAIRKFSALGIDKSYKLADSFLVGKGNNGSEPEKTDEKLQYMWVLSYRGAVESGGKAEAMFAYVDATTGELARFGRINYEEDNAKPKVTEAAAGKTAATLLQSATAEKFSKCKITPREEKLEKDAESADFSYNRYENGVFVEGNSLDVTVSLVTGKINSYGQKWTDNVTFESKDGTISDKAAIDALIGNAKATLCYNIFTTYYYDKEKAESESESESVPNNEIKAENDKNAILVYRFDAPSNRVSAKKGEYVDVNTQNTPFLGITDISGNAYAREIALMGDVGIFGKNSEFKPNEKITQQDFIRYLVAAGGYNDLNDEDVYEHALRAKIIEIGEVEPESYVSAYEAMLFSVRCTGYGELIKHSSIFNADANVPRKYAGAVAIARGLGLWAPKDGVAVTSKALTRAQAAGLIYNLFA